MTRTALALALAGTAAFAAMTGAATAGWLDHGRALLLAYSESGLAWCL